MKAINVLILTGSLAGILVVMAAFKDLRGEKAIKELQRPDSSKGFAVVELFTSEGCSSCPPADKLMEKIQQDNKNKQIYILAFHVDYWDRLGWKDKFSDHEFSNRQGRYASWLNLQTVYTPQIVINGTSEYVGSDQGTVLKAISAGLEQAPAKTLTLDGRITHGQVHVGYQGAGDEKNTELVLALVQKAAQSNVRRGENSGRTLSHVQIVRRLHYLPLGRNTKKDLTIKLPDDFNEKGWELIGFVQHTSDGRITAAGRFDFDTSLSQGK